MHSPTIHYASGLRHHVEMRSRCSQAPSCLGADCPQDVSAESDLVDLQEQDVLKHSSRFPTSNEGQLCRHCYRSIAGVETITDEALGCSA